ncbi:MAG: AAA family ATPase [Actinobacteria bacterium]|nr:AAA family ATPase [Actinomycetota bacterium]
MSGRPGSGKSVVAALLASRLGLSHVSAGDFMRQMAEERGITLLELSRVAETDETIDRDIDARSATLATTAEPFVLDARLGWHFVPDSYKVFLDVLPEIAARRVLTAGRSTEPENVDLMATMAGIEERTQSERRRYLDFYDLDYLDFGQFDVVIDTSHLNPEQVVERIIESIAESGKRPGVR